MSTKVPRMRMFAVPNGSGKSCFNHIVDSKWLGVYVNADDIEKQLRSGGISLLDYKVKIDDEVFIICFKKACVERGRELPGIQCVNGKVTVDVDEVDSYYAAMIAEEIRTQLLSCGISFTFETVMSHESKVAFLKVAQERGYRTYLYFIATEDPQINIERVARRVLNGGHDVPKEKIVSRYHRAIRLLPAALRIVDRGYVFDNSGDKEEWVAETTNLKGETSTSLELKTGALPHWMEAVIETD